MSNVRSPLVVSTIARARAATEASFADWTAARAAGYKGNWIAFASLDDAGRARLWKRLARSHGG